MNKKDSSSQQPRSFFPGGLLWIGVLAVAIFTFWIVRNPDKQLTQASSAPWQEKLHPETVPGTPTGVAKASTSNDSVSVKSSTVAKPLPPEYQIYTPVKYGDGRTMPAWNGPSAEAFVRSGDQRVSLTPNQAGHFPYVYLPMKGSASVAVQLPESEPGTKIGVSVLDGGFIGESKANSNATIMQVDAQNMVKFTFQADQNDGTFRVLVQDGNTPMVVNFWVGEQHPQNLKLAAEVAK